MKVLFVNNEHIRIEKIRKRIKLDGDGKLKLLTAINTSLNPGEKPFYRVIDLSGKHVCKCCNTVVDGRKKGLLCDRCQEIFGHEYFKEL